MFSILASRHVTLTPWLRLPLNAAISKNNVSAI
jgi:hypothetical protein